MRLVIALGLCALGFLLVGCDEQSSNFFVNSNSLFENKSVVDYDFVEFINGCTLYSNFSLNDSGLICDGSDGRRPSQSFFSSSIGWSMLCCDFKSDKCGNQSYSNVSSVCSVGVTANLTVYTGLVSGYWVALCCDPSGSFCYLEENIDVYSIDSYCGKSGNLLTESLTFNYTGSDVNWSGVCCFGGVA